MAFSRAAAKARADQEQPGVQGVFANRQQFQWRSGAGTNAESGQVNWGSLSDVRNAAAPPASGYTGVAGAAKGISWGSVGSARATAASASGYGQSSVAAGAVSAVPSQSKAPSRLSAATSKAQLAEETVLSQNKRIFEVLYKSPVRQEPHLESKKISTKSVGARLYANQVTMNGWLKLNAEPGWILMDMRGMEELGEVVQRKEEVQVAIGGYHAQGICCCEVFYAQAAVRSAPSRSAPQLGLRFRYEYVFVESQSFDGWVKLAKEPGWMLFQSDDYGRLLEPRFDQNALSADLHALCDAWLCVRKAAASKELTDSIVKQLKELEARSLEMAYRWYAELATGEPSVMAEIVETSAISVDDLSLPETWLMRKLFRSAIVKLAGEEEAYKKLMPELSLSTHYPPMMVQEDPAVEAVHVEINGKIYILAIGGILLDQETHEIVGKWNPDTQALDALPEGFDAAAGVAIFQHLGNVYLLNSEGKMLDPLTMTVAGVYNKRTQQVDPLDGEIRIDEPSYGGSESLAEDIDISKHLHRGNDQLSKRRFYNAITEFDIAMKGCEQLRASDLEIECEILNGRAQCYEEVGEYERLFEDAERLLGYDEKNFQAIKWKALAMTRMKEKQKSGRR